MPTAKDTAPNSGAAGVNSQIAEQLRAFYTGIEEEAIPPKFLLLLEQLDAAEQNAQRQANAQPQKAQAAPRSKKRKG